MAAVGVRWAEESTLIRDRRIQVRKLSPFRKLRLG
jgi:hypothetical protein